MVTVGRDEGSFLFETSSLHDQLAALLRVLDAAGRRLEAPRVVVTDLTAGRHRAALRERVLEPLAERFPDVTFGFDDERRQGRGYYRDACCKLYATRPDGVEMELADGGFTTWTRQLLNNAKERLLIGGLGVELLCAHFPTR